MLGGALVGFGFLTKMLQAFLVLPALALVYLLAAPTPLAAADRAPAARRRSRCSSPPAGGSRSSSCGRPRSRPYIGGSQNNSVLELTFGYNGLGRLTGDETGSVGGGGGRRAGAQTGCTRLFNAEIGGQVVWLLPAALVLLARGWLLVRPRRRAPTASRGRARPLGRLAARHRR